MGDIYLLRSYIVQKYSISIGKNCKYLSKFIKSLILAGICYAFIIIYTVKAQLNNNPFIGIFDACSMLGPVALVYSGSVHIYCRTRRQPGLSRGLETEQNIGTYIWLAHHRTYIIQTFPRLRIHFQMLSVCQTEIKRLKLHQVLF